MQATAVFTFVGDDRPGLVEQIAAIVGDHGGNWLESRLAKMAGKFAGIVRIAVDPERLEALTEALDGLLGLNVVVQSGLAPATEANPCRAIHVVGNDRPGIVREVARALAARSLNIVDLESDVTSAPMAGIPLFEATVEFEAPAAMDIDQLIAALDVISEQLDVDIRILDDDR